MLYEKADRRGLLRRGSLSQRALVLSPGGPELASSFLSEGKARGKGRLKAELKEAVSQYFIFIHMCLRIYDYTVYLSIW